MRFGISETSWMLPKILRIRLDTVGRVSVGWAALVAMEVFLFRRTPALAGACLLVIPAGAGIPIHFRRTLRNAGARLKIHGALKRKKPRISHLEIAASASLETS